MKRIKVNLDGHVKCPRNNKFLDYSYCKVECIDCFGVCGMIGRPTHVLCKRGSKKDEVLKKSGRR